MSEYEILGQQSKKKSGISKGLQKTINVVPKESILEDVRISYKDKERIQLQEDSSKHDSIPENTDYPEVIQAYSIEWNENTQTIDDIILDRPPISILNERVLFPDWVMSSSHTTAFVVIKRDLEVRLKGKTFNRALYEIQQMTYGIRNMPGYEIMEDGPKAGVESKIQEICNGIDQLLQGASLDEPTSLLAINRNILIKGYAEDYFLCRNSIYYTFHVGGNGGGAANEAGNMQGLENARSLDEALVYAVNLLDKKYTGSQSDFINIARQHFLSIASFFWGKGNPEAGLEFSNIAGDEQRMFAILRVDKRDEISFTGSEDNTTQW